MFADKITGSSGFLSEGLPERSEKKNGQGRFGVEASAIAEKLIKGDRAPNGCKGASPSETPGCGASC